MKNYLKITQGTNGISVSDWDGNETFFKYDEETGNLEELVEALYYILEQLGIMNSKHDRARIEIRLFRDGKEVKL